MSRILVSGDKHLKITKFETSKKLLSWVNDVIEEQKPDLYVALGDDSDGHAVLRSEIVGEYRKHIDRIMAQKVQSYYIVGNHDYYRPSDPKYHAFQAFSGLHKEFNIVDKITEHDDMTFVPYLYDANTFPKETKRICFAHQTFVGANFGNFRPEEGVDPEQVKAEIIVVGHIHMRQMFGKVIYPGAPIAHDIGDVNQLKGLMLFDTDTYKYSFIDSPFPLWKSLKYEMTSDNSMDAIHDDIKNTINSIDHWIIEIRGPKAEVMAYLSSKQYKNLTKEADIRPNPKFTDREKKLISIKSISMESIVDEYIDKIYNGSINKIILKDVAKDILAKSKLENIKVKL